MLTKKRVPNTKRVSRFKERERGRGRDFQHFFQNFSIVFEIVTPSKVYKLGTESEQARNGWIRDINLTVEKKGGSCGVVEDDELTSSPKLLRLASLEENPPVFNRTTVDPACFEIFKEGTLVKRGRKRKVDQKPFRNQTLV